MPKGEIDRFVAACAKESRKDIAEATRVGRTAWMLGSPSAAADGMIGLSTSPTQTVFLRKEDLLEVRESDGRYLVRIAADTNLLVREEQVARLDPDGCHCRGDGDSMAKKKGGGDRAPGPIIIECTTVCSVETVCSPYKDGSTGAVIQVCWPQLVCRNPCEGVLT